MGGRSVKPKLVVGTSSLAFVAIRNHIKRPPGLSYRSANGPTPRVRHSEMETTPPSITPAQPGTSRPRNERDSQQPEPIPEGLITRHRPAPAQCDQARRRYCASASARNIRAARWRYLDWKDQLGALGRHEPRNGNKTSKSDAWRTNKTKNKTVLEGRIRKETRRHEVAWGVSLETLKTAAEFLLGPTMSLSFPVMVYGPVQKWRRS
jgi:hypothetical protein